MKDKVVIFGTSIFSLVAYQTIVQDDLAEVIGFTLNEKYIQEPKLEGLNIYPFESLSDCVDMRECKILIALGYKNMNDNRKAAYDKCKEFGFNVFTLVSKRATLYTTEIGEGSIILPMAFVGPYVSIGKSVILWNNVSICHHNKVGDFTHIAGGTTIGGETNIGSNCFIGMNCTFKNGIEVGDRTFVGANSYMSKSTEGGLGFVGNPAINPRGAKSDLMIKFL